MRLTVRAHPGSREDAFAWIDPSTADVRVRARAHDGEANDAVRRVVADALGVAPSRVTLLRGHRSRIKLVEIAD
jgi:uncharacterized protein YggU (UPF0235/DUF167 family)